MYLTRALLNNAANLFFNFFGGLSPRKL